MSHAYTGPGYTDEECARALAAAAVEAERLDDDALFPLVAERIAEGEVVGWFQGRMEFGPRALGNRSIVVDPRRPDMTDVLNPRYFRLISEFERRTGVPILLNTSFNENEPIVMTPEQALDTFGKTRMDMLVLGNHVVRRNA